LDHVQNWQLLGQRATANRDTVGGQINLRRFELFKLFERISKFDAVWVEDGQVCARHFPRFNSAVDYLESLESLDFKVVGIYKHGDGWWKFRRCPCRGGAA